MTDKQWQVIIDKCRSAYFKHSKLRELAEDEYVRRYGKRPSEVDDDWWIDTVQYCRSADASVAGIIKAADDVFDRNN